MIIFQWEDHRRRVTVDDTGSTTAFFPNWGFGGPTTKPCKTKREALEGAKALIEWHGKSNPDDIKPVISALNAEIATNCQQELFGGAY